MVVGFNHNFRYRGEVYHVQTEDSGIKNPHIITLLYRGGTILASKKTSYADIVKADNLEQVVEELMKAQHKEMLRRLKDGECDELIFGSRPAAAAAAERPAVDTAAGFAAVAAAAAAPTPVATAAASVPARPRLSPPLLAAQAAVPAATPPVPPVEPPPEEKRLELSLDEMILSYLVGEDN